jgi:hypothetical protein
MKDDVRKAFELQAALAKALRAIKALKNNANKLALIATAKNAKLFGIPTAIGLFGIFIFRDKSPSSTPSSTSTTTTTTSTSTSSSSTALPTEFLLFTRSGTPMAAYKALILLLPDAGTGSQIAYPSLSF